VKKEYLGFKVKQRQAEQALSLFTFCASARDLMNWVGVRRNAEHEGGAQRYLAKTRVNAITRFLKVDEINTIPNSILIAFDRGIASFKSLENSLPAPMEAGELGLLSFDYDESTLDSEKPALIVDGQHRLYGIAEYDQEDIPLIVVALLDAAPIEQAFQFIVINKKAKSVETDTAKSILADFIKGDQQTLLNERLQKVRIVYEKTSLAQFIDDDPLSPFYQIINFPHLQTDSNNGKREDLKVKDSTIENCLQYIRNRFESLLINDDDSLIILFLSIWDFVAHYYPDLWRKNSQFMSSVNLAVLNKFLTDKIAFAWSIDLIDTPLNLEQTTLVLQRSLVHIPQLFWEYDWGRVEDNRHYRKILEESLQEIDMNIRTGQKWNQNLYLFAETQLL